ncbi:MAG: glycoside hydrolase family 16 protein [Bacteroidota bacterium]
MEKSLGVFTIALLLLIMSCKPETKKKETAQEKTSNWQVDFFDDFDTFNKDNWQDQMIWVNNEDQCYVPEGEFNTREVSNGTLKLRVVDIGTKRPCDNLNVKTGEKHPDTQYAAGRIISKNRKEFAEGKWTARLRVKNSGLSGMFPAWWLLGAYNNEPPVEDEDETVCWPLQGSGEIDIFEHHSDGGPDHYAARAIKNLGECQKGDWQGKMLVQEAKLEEYHDYSVEWDDKDLVFRLDEVEVYRAVDEGANIPEPMFAILNFAKINDSPLTQTWEMEVDWVKYESRKR